MCIPPLEVRRGMALIPRKANLRQVEIQRIGIPTKIPERSFPAGRLVGKNTTPGLAGVRDANLTSSSLEQIASGIFQRRGC